MKSERSHASQKVRTSGILPIITLDSRLYMSSSLWEMIHTKNKKSRTPRLIKSLSTNDINTSEVYDA